MVNGADNCPTQGNGNPIIVTNIVHHRDVSATVAASQQEARVNNFVVGWTADKTASLLIDADTSGGVSAGDVLQYRVTIKNVGNRAASTVTYTDTPDAHTTLVAGSVRTNRGSVTGGNAGIPPITVDIGTLPVGAEATITYQVTIAKPLAPDVTEVVNQGIARSPDTPDVPTNDPRTPAPGDPTRTPITSIPVLSADKTDFLVIDTNKSGRAGAGDTIAYVVEIANRGNVDATNVQFTDTPDVFTTLVNGSVATSQGTVTKGNSAGDVDLVIDIGLLPVGASVQISFQVQLKAVLPRPFIDNQGMVTVSGAPMVPTNDPHTPLAGDPTRTIIPAGEVTSVVLVGFTATHSDNGIVVRWITSGEYQTWGFYLYRSADGERGHAVRVTPELIGARGRGMNEMTYYNWLDSTNTSDTIYTYWLQEIELNGTLNEYGPTTTAIAPALSHTMYLPIAAR